MNKHEFQGVWPEVRGEVKTFFHDLTEKEVKEVNGNIEVLLGLLQKRYGFTREKAEHEVELFVDKVKK